MTGNELKKRRMAAGLITRVLAARMSVGAGTLNKEENRGDGEIENQGIRLALYEITDLFAPHDVKRDGPEPRAPSGAGPARTPKRAKPNAADPMTVAQGARMIELLEQLVEALTA
jgi:hypothetical protein